MCIIQAENLSRSQLVDYFVISAMTFLWAFMPTDGIAIVTHWFFNKVLNVSIYNCTCVEYSYFNSLALEQIRFICVQ